MAHREKIFSLSEDSLSSTIIRRIQAEKTHLSPHLLLVRAETGISLVSENETISAKKIEIEHLF